MKNKIQWLDTLKGLAIILVVLGHSFPDKVGYPSEVHCRAVFEAIYLFHMPLMFWIAGFLSLDVLNYSDSDRVHWGGADGHCGRRYIFLKKRFLRLMVPYCVFGLIYLPFKLIAAVYVSRPWDMDSSWKIILGVNPNGSLWFLYALFFIQVILALIVTKDRMANLLFVSWVVWFGLKITGYNFYHITSIAHYFFFVVLGLWSRMLYNDKWIWQESDGHLMRGLQFLGSKSMDIYIFHMAVLGIIRIVAWQILHFNYYMVCILMFVCGVIVPLIISKYIVRKSLWLRRLILGMDW